MDQFSTPQKTPIRSVLKEINTNKSASGGNHVAAKNSLTLDSDISGIDADTTLSSGFDTTIDTSYKNENPNATFSDLIGGFGGLKLNTPQRLPKPSNADGNNSVSSDEELFQECENGFDLDATAVVPDVTSVRAHSSNIDHNVFDKTINFSSITANSTAGLVTTTSDASLPSDKSDTFFQSGIANQTINGESVSSGIGSSINQSNAVDGVPEVPSVESFGNSHEEVNHVEEVVPAKIDNIVDEYVDNAVEEADLSSTCNLEAHNRTATVLPKVNLDETVVVENKLPSIDTSFVVSPKTSEPQPNQVNDPIEAAPEQKENTTTSDASLPSDKSDTFFQSDIANKTINGDNVSSAIGSSIKQSNAVDGVLEVPSVESFGNSYEEENRVEEVVPAKIDIIVDEYVNNTVEEADVSSTCNFEANNKTATVLPKVNMNETVVVENKLPSIDTSFIVSSKTSEPQPNQVNGPFETVPEQKENTTTSDASLPSNKSDTFFQLDIANQTINGENVSSAIGSSINQSNAVDGVPEVPSVESFGNSHEEGNRVEEVIPAKIDNIVDEYVNNTVEEADVSSTCNFEANNKTATVLPKFNMNETVVVENKLPSIDTSFIVSPKTSEPQPNQVNDPFEAAPEQKENTFKLPAKPTKTTNPFDMKNQTQNQFDVSDDEFQTPGLILNSNDFDFLLSRGAPSGQANPRDSILERFDPILGRKSVVPASLINKAEPISIAAVPSVSTILEVDNSITESVKSNESLAADEKSPVEKSNAAINESGDRKQIAKLESFDKLDVNIGGDGDSLASSTTETYETASIGEPLKADVTMSVGLIHDLKMDNMKSLEQDKEEPNLKMNDEHKVKQEMVGDIERKLKEAEAREEALLRRITEKEKALNKMSAVVENYEKTMVEMISEREQITQNYEKQLMQLKTERDANFHHLTSLENTFSDLHLKYEKSKQMALEVKDSEAKLVEKLEFCQQQMKLQEQRYDKLKNHALSQLEGANSKLEALSKAHSNEMKKLTAQLKKEEISRQSIMEQLAQKTKENDELVKICDELINNGPDGS